MANRDTVPLIQHLHSRLQPVIHAFPDGRGEVFGSSILLQVAERFFFVSAAHVFKVPPAGAPLQVVGDCQSVRLLVEDVVGGTDNISLNPAEGLIDVAFVEISSANVSRLGNAAAVQMSELDVNESLKPTKGRYLAIGYPASETSVPADGDTVHVRSSYRPNRVRDLQYTWSLPEHPRSAQVRPDLNHLARCVAALGAATLWYERGWGLARPQC